MNAPATPPKKEPAPAPAQPPGQNRRQRGRARQPSQESVAARAARMAKRSLGEKVTGWAHLIGVKADDPEAFEKALRGLKTEREKGMSDGEKASARLAELEGQMKRVGDENARLKNALNRSEKERKREVQRRRNEEIEREIREAATGVGFGDPAYALHLFREHVVGQGQHAGDPKAFFESLRSKPDFKHLFRETPVPAGPKPSAPKPEERAAGQEGGEGERPEGRSGDNLPDQGAPAPARPGKVGKPDGVDDVSKMDKRSFAKRTRERYAFTPSM